MGREEPRGCPDFVSQSQVGKAVCPFLELSGVGRTMADGTDEDGAHAAKMDEWIAWETEEVEDRGGDGIICSVLFSFCFLFSFLGHISLWDERRCLEIKIK